MPCKPCQARRQLAREAAADSRPLEAAKHIAKGAAEALGLKTKTGEAELLRKRQSDRGGGAA